MKLQPHHKGSAVRLTDPNNCDENFREKFDGFSDEWVMFWKEYKDRTLFVKDAKQHERDWDGRLSIYLDGLPNYIDHDIPFYADEIDGIVPSLPEELFKI